MTAPVRILVVDDEEPLRRTYEAILARRGYMVTTAANGAEAVELLAVQSFEVVLTDMNMPVMDGLELTRHIHERGLTTTVIPMSGAHPISEKLMSETVRLGARATLHKPFTAEQLFAAVEAAVR